MKNLFRLLTFVAVGVCLLSCNKDEHMSLKKPVLTADMFAVTTDAESGEKITGCTVSVPARDYKLVRIEK